ncbi:MAG: hypothetical protein LBH50_01715 [Spirochaetaceae bacterium]|jgi:hypothetical protein|nr:hypothetical protein [Spirochaetaceae bacterium]
MANDSSIPTMDKSDGEREKKADAIEGGFPHAEKLLEETGHDAFDDPNYYTSAIADEGELSQRLHTVFRKYATTSDHKDRAVFRLQITNVFWEFLGKTAAMTTGNLSAPKKYLLRFGVLHPNLLNADAKDFLSKLPVTDNTGQPVYYLDEWMRNIGLDKIKCSVTDESGSGAEQGALSARLTGLLEKAQGKFEGAKGLLRVKNAERLEFEKNLSTLVQNLLAHSPYKIFPEAVNCYTEEQKRVFAEIQDCMKTLLKIDREAAGYMRDIEQGDEDIKTINEKLKEAGAEAKETVDLQAINTEFSSIRQMAKMTIGRQGNTFPILSSEFFRPSQNYTGFKENVIKLLSWVESVDAEAFIRYYKNKPNRIEPYVILLPTYGDFGICWEPFEKSNRATSRGRVAIPMYPKNLAIALLSAIGDMRWQVAKETASYYWMEEGLTGNYYQWFQAQKLKGDVKIYFIQDYIIWMTKESEGIQKLDKDVRGTFWRYMPFTQPVKEKLKDRNLVYQELYQRDKNRAMSDGY